MSTKMKRKQQQAYESKHGPSPKPPKQPKPPPLLPRGRRQAAPAPSKPAEATRPTSPAITAPAGVANRALVERRLANRVPTKVGPTISQRGMIESLSRTLGIEPNVPQTEAEAKFLIDDLIHEERSRKRKASPVVVKRVEEPGRQP